MPKRIILLDRVAGRMRYVLRADVPSGNQNAYANPSAVSAYENATPAELQEVRNGLIAERVGILDFDGAPTASIQTYLQPLWQKFQDEINAQTAWAEYGRSWDGTTWSASPGVPMQSAKEYINGDLPSFVALTPVSSFAANKFHLVLFNGAATTTGQCCVIKVRLVVLIPGLATVTGVAPSAFTLRRRSAPTTAPSGTGGIAIASTDSAHPLPTVVTAFSPPQTPPAGGSVAIYNEFVPQADEVKLSTADAPTMATLQVWGGQTIYRAADVYPARPLTIRAGETLEVQQSATGGTGNCRVLVVFTVG